MNVADGPGMPGPYGVGHTACFDDGMRRRKLLADVIPALNRDAGGWSIQRNEVGDCVADCWLAIPAHFPRVDVDVLAILPDHIHGLLHFRPAPPDEESTSTLGSVVGGFKSAVSRRVAAGHARPLPLWQRGFYDRILSDPAAIEACREYILTNTVRHEFAI